ncbi:MAG: hypothetical protein Kow0069_20110 [Promethearchaeota archaeon]
MVEKTKNPKAEREATKLLNEFAAKLPGLVGHLGLPHDELRVWLAFSRQTWDLQISKTGVKLRPAEYPGPATFACSPERLVAVLTGRASLLGEVLAGRALASDARKNLKRWEALHSLAFAFSRWSSASAGESSGESGGVSK